MSFLFSATFMANTFAMTGVMIVLSLAGNPELAADVGIVHGATLALFFAFSGNARSLILNPSSTISVGAILGARLLLLVPLGVLSLLLSTHLAGVDALLAFTLVLWRGVEWMRGNLRDQATIDALLAPNGDLIHLAFPEGWTPEQHLAANAILAERAVATAVRRVLHCSTAVVVGKTREHRVNEQTPPQPVTEYEVTKLEIEQIWRERCGDRVELAILRPTAVFGPGGRNLLKLANAVVSGNPIANYLRSSLFGRRRMNLVPVGSVVAALKFVLDLPDPLRTEAFIVSADEDPANNFRDIEKLLRKAMDVPDYPIPPLASPPDLLAAALRLAGRSNWDPKRTYEAEKLVRAGYRNQPGALERGLREFAGWFGSENAPRCAETA